MGMLDRYKKKGGFTQLLTLIETSGKAKQEQFLKLIAEESPVWEDAIRKKSLSLDKILSWNSMYLSEVISRVQPLTLATAFRGLPKDRLESVLSCLSVSDRRKIMQAMDESNPTPAEISTCIMKFLTETRGLIHGGILKMDKVDPELAIPDNFEDQLNSAVLTKALGTAMGSEPIPSEDKPGELNFDGPRRHQDPHAEHNKEEVEFLKKRVNQLSHENTALKQEVAVLRGKLDQIKKIA